MKTEQLTPGQQFMEISQRMNKAWGEMIESGQYLVYKGISHERVEKLRNGGSPKKGEEHLAEYLNALGELITLTQSKD